MNQPSKKEVEIVPVINPDFSITGSVCDCYDGSCTAGWAMRPGVGFNGNPVGELDFNVYRSAPASLKIVASTPGDTGECDRTVWQCPRQDMAPYQGQTVKLSAWVRHTDCTSNCGIVNQYSGTMLTNWDCCEYEGICSNPSHFQGPWCDINSRGGVRLGMDFYDGSMFRETVVTDDWISTDNEWHYLEFETEVPQNYYAPTGEGPFSATQAIIWIQGFPCESDATFWMDDVSLIVIDSSPYSSFINSKDYFISGIDSFATFINNGNNWVNL